MSDYKSKQSRFFEYLIRRKSSDMVLHTLMETLHIKKGAAYKRMNGSTMLSVDEMVELSRQFGFSLDTATNSEQFFSFEHPFIDGGNSSDFLDRYAFYLKPLTEGEKGSTLTYVANELPVFYYFSHRHIFTFLIAVWKHLHWDEHQLRIKENDDIALGLEHLRNDVSQFYQSHPVTEIWNSNMMSNLYQQITFCITIRAFENESFVSRLIIDIEKLLMHLQNVAGTGQKSEESSKTKIYLNEFGNYLNLALYESDSLSSAFVGFDIPHFIVSYNDKFCKFSSEWVEKIRHRSILISSEGYQFRELFFMKLNKDFVEFKDRVSKLMAVYY